MLSGVKLTATCELSDKFLNVIHIHAQPYTRAMYNKIVSSVWTGIHTGSKHKPEVHAGL